MKSLILRTATRLLTTLLLLFSIFLLLRGHNEPGGGFVGGLMAASAFVLYSIAFDPSAARRALRFEPTVLIGAGLLLALLSGLVGVARGLPFMTGVWGTLPGLMVELGTPLVFDIGVYLTVIGVTTSIILTLAEE
ncbi:Na+/H+ antiporter subunit B [Kallotenue papyrolyticum]|uniref:Na+/H+ antiporter subunit B n=1 Tax=Kallotenue papyrolyticum TaxID=1325125 RepID=UPI000492423B|nr:Na+/H+ antiporter subunit B [Kallotenue papyrolyticum]